MIQQSVLKLLTGRQFLRDELPLNDRQIKEHLLNQTLRSSPSITKSTFQLICNRCFNNERYLFGTLPCGICNQEHLYCRKCIQMGRVLECEALYEWIGSPYLWPKHDSPLQWTGKLTPKQNKAASRIITALLDNEPELLIWAVTGAGKTEMLFPAINEALNHGKRVCLVTPRADVVRELSPRIQEAFPKINVAALYGESKVKYTDSQFILATTHQLIRYKDAFDLMIIDEVDAFPFHQDKMLPQVTKRARKEQSTTIYLTATPNHQEIRRMNQKELPHYFISQRYHGFPLPVPTFKIILSLQKKLRLGQLPSKFIRWLESRQNKERQLLIFVPTIRLAESFVQNHRNLLKEKKLITHINSIQYVHAEDERRDEKVLAFRKGEICILVTTTILERGVTFPSVDVAVLDAGHQVFDEAALVQIAGRAGRSAKDPTGEIIFFHDGKTKAMVQSVRYIKEMNHQGVFV